MVSCHASLSKQYINFGFFGFFQEVVHSRVWFAGQARSIFANFGVARVSLFNVGRMPTTLNRKIRFSPKVGDKVSVCFGFRSVRVNFSGGSRGRVTGVGSRGSGREVQGKRESGGEKREGRGSGVSGEGGGRTGRGKVVVVVRTDDLAHVFSQIRQRMHQFGEPCPRGHERPRHPSARPPNSGPSQ